MNLTVDPRAARRCAEALAEMLDRTGSPIVTALSRWAHGLIDDDPAGVEWAATQLGACCRVPEAALADHDAALMHARAGAMDDARRLATSAVAAYELLGAERYRRQLLADLRTAGLTLRPRRAHRRATAGWDSLTDAERAIVALVADGKSNTEIGAQLFVSRRTVESHLVRVYAKLDVRNRAELAAGAVHGRGGETEQTFA
jgi:DNA-binding CsgD family transcriptional regulator